MSVSVRRTEQRPVVVAATECYCCIKSSSSDCSKNDMAGWGPVPCVSSSEGVSEEIKSQSCKNRKKEGPLSAVVAAAGVAVAAAAAAALGASPFQPLLHSCLPPALQERLRKEIGTSGGPPRRCC